MSGGVMAAEILARLESMAAEIDALRAQTAAQASHIARLRAGVRQPGTRVDGGERPRPTSRRCLLTGALAAGAAITALAASRATPADAHDADDILRNGNTDTTVGAALINASGTGLLTQVFVGANYNGDSFFDPSARIGVRGAVRGTDTGNLPRYGVYGHVDGTVPNAGVYGDGNQGYGVMGTSGGGAGVRGQSTLGVGVSGRAIGASTIGVSGESTAIDSSAIGVYGFVSAANAAGTGVKGTSTSGNGVLGTSTNGIGVYGQSSNNYGMQGVTTKTGYAGLVGVGTVAGSAGFYALGVNGASAGTFQGSVIVNGSLTVTSTKSAAVKKKDGTLARMYCVEAPESWFEDFGTAQLQNGQATVDLDPEFDQVVRGDDYRVFLTAVGDTGFLYVSQKGPHRFEVRSRDGATAKGSFDYRVVARRLDDVGRRLEKVEVPTMATIDVDRLTRSASPPNRER
jgi:hypothetical protein